MNECLEKVMRRMEGLEVGLNQDSDTIIVASLLQSNIFKSILKMHLNVFLKSKKPVI